jgi:hypothetical protein
LVTGFGDGDSSSIGLPNNAIGGKGGALASIRGRAGLLTGSEVAAEVNT